MAIESIEYKKLAYFVRVGKKFYRLYKKIFFQIINGIKHIISVTLVWLAFTVGSWSLGSIKPVPYVESNLFPKPPIERINNQQKNSPEFFKVEINTSTEEEFLAKKRQFIAKNLIQSTPNGGELSSKSGPYARGKELSRKATKQNSVKPKKSSIFTQALSPGYHSPGTRGKSLGINFLERFGINSQVDLQQSQRGPSSIKMVDRKKESDILIEIDKEMNANKSSSSKINEKDDRNNKVPSKKIDGSVQDKTDLQTTQKLEENSISWDNLSAEQKYDEIRESITDVDAIARNTGYKKENVQNCKNYVFHNTHKLDRYEFLGEPVQTKRFDPDDPQAQAWKRLETGTYSPEYLTWLKHEKAEQWYEQKHDAGYSESHDKAEKHWSGNPWADKESKNNLEDK